MAKKTSVILPGGIQNLVNNLQSGNARFQQQVDKEEAAREAEKQEETQEQDDEKEAALRNGQQGQEGRETVGAAADDAGQKEGRGAAPVSEPARVEEPASGYQSARGGQTELRRDSEPEAPARGRRPKEEVKTYDIIRDNTKDSWDLFLDMAQQYKQGGGKLATIYIDPQLKAVLDRLKYIGPEKFPTSAILSSIVARFIYDHEQEIKDIIYNQRLL